MNFRQKMTVVVVDVLILVEMTVSLFLASQVPEEFTSTFCKYFFGMLIPTLVAARIFIKRYRSPEVQTNL